MALFVRHGEAEHNVRKRQGKSEGEPKTVDPGLTDLGFEQAKRLKLYLNDHIGLSRHFEVCVTSPLKRALQTTRELDFRPVHVSHLHSERNPGGSPSDTGSSKKELKEMFPEFDFDQLPDVWWGTVESDSDWKTKRTTG